jgi:hypothetical protein
LWLSRTALSAFPSQALSFVPFVVGVAEPILLLTAGAFHRLLVQKRINYDGSATHDFGERDRHALRILLAEQAHPCNFRPALRHKIRFGRLAPILPSADFRFGRAGIALPFEQCF